MNEDPDESEKQITFYCGNPVVETTEGIIHIYKNQYVIVIFLIEF